MPKAVVEKPNKNEQKIFDSFMEFLRSDLWLIPISQFIEQRSIVFEREPDLSVVPGTADSYHGVHREFGGMVNDLLNAYCQDSGQTKDEVMDALKAHDKAQGLTQKQRMLLEPIVAAQDFDVFVPMMMRKNIELQLQALKMIEHMKGLVPNSLTLGQEDAEIWETLGEEEESERLILISVLKQSKEEWEMDQRMRQDWQEQMEAAIRESLREKSHLEEMRRREQNLLEEALNKASEGTSFMFEFKNLSIIGQPQRQNEGAATATTAAMVMVEEEDKPRISGDKQRMISPMKEDKPKQANAKKDNHQDKPKDKPQPAAKLTEEANEKRRGQQKEKDKLRRTTSNEGGEGGGGGGGTADEKENGKAKGNKRLSLGQVHAPRKLKEAGEKGADGGDLGYRSLLKQREGIPEEALQSRMQYLREQRDKLLMKKSREREKQLIEAAANQNNAERPRTAKAARGIMEQGGMGGGGGGQADDDLEQRRRIAAKIKAEVIDNKGEQQTLQGPKVEEKEE